MRKITLELSEDEYELFVDVLYSGRELAQRRYDRGLIGSRAILEMYKNVYARAAAHGHSIDTAKERVEVELHELTERVDKLTTFLRAQNVKRTLNDNALNPLYEQRRVMLEYQQILRNRLQSWED